MKARCIRRVAGEQNKTEAAFAAALALMSNVLDYRFEAVTLKIAKDCRYTPDFMVLYNDGSIHFYEVKGFWRDDARVKIKVAARMFSEFNFTAVTRKGGEWQYEHFTP